MAKGDLKVTVDKFFTQTRIAFCSTQNCANRKDMKLECNFKDIEIQEGKCSSFVGQERTDIIPNRPWPRN